jgi:hypothetical protein
MGFEGDGLISFWYLNMTKSTASYQRTHVQRSKVGLEDAISVSILCNGS